MTTTAELLAQGWQCQRESDRPRAEQISRQILQLEPGNVSALHLLGVSLHAAGRLAEAVEQYQKLLKIDQSRAEVYNDLGTALAMQGRLDEALFTFERVVQIDPESAAGHHNLGNALRLQGQPEQALTHFEEALRLNPSYGGAHKNLGLALLDLDRSALAIGSLQQALRLMPKDSETLAALQRALQSNPGFPDARNGVGNALSDSGRLDEAMVYYHEALRLNPGFAGAYSNLGNVAVRKGLRDEALAKYAQALSLDPDLAEAHTNRGLIWLLQGDFRRGWAEYEWRLRLVDNPQRSFSQPLWDGSPLHGKTILLHAEQGHGDTIQFIRYAPLVKQRGGRVIVECQPLLARLLAGVAGVDELVVSSSTLPAFDVHAPLLSLPRIFDTAIDTIPAPIPYLHADAELVQQWRTRLESAPAVGQAQHALKNEGGQRLPILRVGIAWHGNPNLTVDWQRSVPLTQFARLAQVKGIQLISLQKGHGAEQLPSVAKQFPLQDVAGHLADFMDSAALMRNLDLVITVDTAVAHLAGALGIRVWVALPYTPDWRWQLQRQDSPWYPTMRLFRQSQSGRWPEVFERMAQELTGLLALPGVHDKGALEQLFVQAGQHRQASRWSQAEQIYRQILLADPGNIDALHFLGVSLHAAGKLPEAVEQYQNVLRINPARARVYNDLGTALGMQGRMDEAIVAFQRLLQSEPDFAAGHYNLAHALRFQGRWEEAIGPLQQVVRLKPTSADAAKELGIALYEQRRWDEAIACFRQALTLNPAAVDVHHKLGLALCRLGLLDEAIACFHQALLLDPSAAEVHHNLGLALFRQGLLDEANTCFQKALSLKPDYPIAHNSLGNSRKDQGMIDDAMTSYQRACQLQPQNEAYHSNLVYALLFHSGYDAHAMLEEGRNWDLQHAQVFADSHRKFPNDPSPERRLRVGYVSPDFSTHIVGRCVWPFISSHDHEQFEIFLYPSQTSSDWLTEKFQKCADGWCNIAGWADQRVADRICQDRIDVLVDLTMHAAGQRLLVFARKPAPVQVCYNYPGSTGLKAIDYRLTDPFLDPPGMNDDCYSEQSYRLPHTFWCYDPLTEEPSVGPLPALEHGFITFSCLNNFCKVNDGVLELWSKVLRAVDRSRLKLLAKKGSHRQKALDYLARQGIAPERIEFYSPRPRTEYLALYHQFDIGLDAFPCNGHTTSLDSFWMGVPVITLIGKTVVGRAGLSQLANLGLEELAVATPEDFVRVAVGLADDLPRLQSLRSTLRERMRQSPLMDALGFTRAIEQAYRVMWRQWCEGTSAMSKLD